MATARCRRFGPIHVDAPTTPDRIGALDGDAWLQSGGSLVGADNAPHAIDSQKDAAAVLHHLEQRHAAHGLDRGELEQRRRPVYLPRQRRPAARRRCTTPTRPAPAAPARSACRRAFTANYLVWVQDGQTATLLRSTGGAWQIVQALDEPLYLLDVNTPCAPTLRCRSRCWASRPPRRSRSWPWPAKKARSSSGRPSPTRTRSTARAWSARSAWAAIIGDFALTQAYSVRSLQDDVDAKRRQAAWRGCAGGDHRQLWRHHGRVPLRRALRPAPAQHAAGRQPRRRAGSAAARSASHLVPVGDGQTISYTLRYENLGGTIARNVQIRASAYGALRLAGGGTTADLQPWRHRRWHLEHPPDRRRDRHGAERPVRRAGHHHRRRAARRLRLALGAAPGRQRRAAGHHHQRREVRAARHQHLQRPGQRPGGRAADHAGCGRADDRLPRSRRRSTARGAAASTWAAWWAPAR